MSDEAPRAQPAHQPTLGALYDGRITSFRVWAPDHTRVELVLERHAPASAPAGTAARGPFDVRSLQRDEHGYWHGRFDDAAPGTRYRYRLNRSDAHVFPDPASRFQPAGVHGPSQVIDPAAFAWTDGQWRPPALDRLVFYELHVGTFSPPGTYRGVVERLPYLSRLGITALELMPLGDFPGDRNWGYDPAALFAPARCYGTPDELRGLVDAAHAHGLAVFVDVVYNHLGPDGAYANAFSPYYFTDAHRSPWGRGVNLDGPHSAEVRAFFLENALHWVTEYHVDGLRLDATHAMTDDSPRHFLAELTTTVRARAGKPVLLVAEDHRNLADLVKPVEANGFGMDAIWADDFHHQARVRTAGDREGYYADFSGSMAHLADTLRQGWFFTGQHSGFLGTLRGTDASALSPERFVICIQNHDQIGNRADGARLNHEIEPAAFRAASVLLLLAPQTPLLFMGQEWAAGTPFLYFTDHDDELGRLVTEGRREEFRSFSAFADPERRLSIPDPQDERTFARSRLDWSEPALAPHSGVLRLYERLLALRHAHPALRPGAVLHVRALDAHTLVLDRRVGDDAIVAAIRLSGAGAVSLGVGGPCRLVLSTEDADVTDEPWPIATDVGRGDDWRAEVQFRRPGAVVLQSR